MVGLLPCCGMLMRWSIMVASRQEPVAYAVVVRKQREGDILEGARNKT